MEEAQHNRPLDYAPVPKGMSRAKLALIVGTAGATLVIGGVVYHMTRPAPPRVFMTEGVRIAPSINLQAQTPATSPAAHPNR